MILWRSVYRGSLYRSVVSVYKRVTTILLRLNLSQGLCPRCAIDCSYSFPRYWLNTLTAALSNRETKRPSNRCESTSVLNRGEKFLFIFGSRMKYDIRNLEGQRSSIEVDGKGGERWIIWRGRENGYCNVATLCPLLRYATLRYRARVHVAAGTKVAQRAGEVDCRGYFCHEYSIISRELCLF